MEKNNIKRNIFLILILALVITLSFVLVACTNNGGISNNDENSDTHIEDDTPQFSDEDTTYTKGLEFQYIPNNDAYDVIAYNGNENHVIIPKIYNGKPVTCIAYSAFQGKTRIYSVKIPEGIQLIERYAFKDCAMLEQIFIPSSVIAFGQGAFESCTELKKVEFANNSQYDASEQDIFKNCLVTEAIVPAKAVSILPRFSIIELKINSGTKIPNNAFNGGIVLDTLIIGDSVEEIGNNAFEMCSTLRQIEFGSNIKKIGKCSFKSCTSITSINLPKLLNIIEEEAFAECDDLLNINFNIDSNDIILGKYSFKNCKSISNVYLNNISLIGAGAFENCINLNTVYMQEGLEIIGDGAFEKCEKLTEITIPSTVYKMGFSAFADCISLTKVTFAKDILLSKIDDMAFANSAVKNIVIPRSITEISDLAFSMCQGLKTVQFEEGSQLKIIGDYVFSNTAIIEIKIPTNVESIGDWTFSLCEELVKIVFEKGSCLHQIGENIFSNSYNINYLETPAEIFAFVMDRIDYQYSGENYVDNVVINSGNFAETTTKKLHVRNLSICSSIISVGNSFKECYSIESLTTSANVLNQIYTDNLAEINVNGGNIPTNALKDNYNLRSIILNNVTKIGDSAFNGCTKLTSISIPDTVTHIGNKAFYNCKNLNNISLPKKLTTIGNYAFGGCSLNNILIPNSVYTIGENVFSGCEKIQIYCESTKTKAGWSSNWNSNYNFYLYSENEPKNGGLYWHYINNDFAKWDMIIYNIKYDLQGGTLNNPNPDKYTYVDDIVLNNPNKAHYDFIGWKDQNENIITEIPKHSIGDVSLTAVWEPIKYNINYVVEGGINNPNNKSIITIESGGFTLYEPISEYYIFEGWYSDELLTKKITEISELKDMTIYSKFYNYVNGLEYTITENDDYEISNYNGSLHDFSIPTTYQNKPIKSIGYGAFANNQTIENIVIKNNISNISENAFCECSNLKTIKFENNNQIKYIRDKTFLNCVNLIEVNIPSSVEELVGEINNWNTGAFTGCIKLRTVNFDKNSKLKKIGHNTFKNCKNIVEFTIPNSVEEIHRYSFNHCVSLEKVNIPISVRFMDYDVFNNNPKLLISCEAAQEPEQWDNDWNRARAQVVYGINNIKSNGEYDYVINNNKAYLTKYKSNKNIVTIPTTIDGYPVDSFGSTFQNNTQLIEINVPSSISNIVSEAFYNCNQLTKVTLPKEIINFGYGIFYNCNSLQIVNLPENLIDLPQYTFCGCNNLRTVALPNNIIRIGIDAFNGCASLTSIFIPKSVNDIAYRTFTFCGKLEEIVVEEGNKTYHSKNNCLIKTANNELIFGCKNSIIPDYVTKLSENSFNGCINLVSINIPSAVTIIGSDTFWCCGNLKQINYNGTKSNWKNIKKYSYWNRNGYGFDNYIPAIVHCIDGDLTMQQM